MPHQTAHTLRHELALTLLTGVSCLAFALIVIALPLKAIGALHPGEGDQASPSLFTKRGHMIRLREWLFLVRAAPQFVFIPYLIGTYALIGFSDVRLDVLLVGLQTTLQRQATRLTHRP